MAFPGVQYIIERSGFSWFGKGGIRGTLILGYAPTYLTGVNMTILYLSRYALQGPVVEENETTFHSRR